MGDLLQAAESGQLDLDYGEQQLRVAAIRLREDLEYVCDAGSVPREGKCGKFGHYSTDISVKFIFTSSLSSLLTIR